MGSPTMLPDALLSDPCYFRLKGYLVEATGLAYYEDKDADFARRIGCRLANLRLRDCASYFDMLRDPERGPAELDALIAEITIGETHFFRHMEHFDALRELVLPDLMKRNETSRRLRIWSAGCADGAEPYSLSILTKRDLGQQLAGWEVSIVATDINRRSLANAREGNFEDWCLRATPEDVKRNCFLQQGKKWALASQYKEGVSFQFHNLVETPFPSILSNLSAMDLIVCRNVMIYFAPGLMQRMIRQFHDCLVPGAWLLVGPSEPNMTFFTSFHTVNAPGVTLYQKPVQATPSPVSNQISARLSALCPLPPLSKLPPHANVEAVVQPQAKEGVETTLVDIRCHLDRGDWEKAAACCERLLKTENLKSLVHFQYALALEQLSRHDEAEQSLRRALYLDRQFVLAHYYLGILLLSRGHSRKAAQSFENTVKLLNSRCDTEVLADAGGITVAELKKVAQSQLEIIMEQA
jgi:chemotaxis protein methyltransferase CheR